MTKKEFLELLDSMIDDEINITNLQSEDFCPDALNTLWTVRKMADALEVN